MPVRPAQLERMRARARKDLTDRCIIERAAAVTDEYGEVNQGFSTLISDVPCRVVATAMITGREQVRLESLAQVTDWMVILPAEQDITSQDRIRITRGSSLGRVFEATQVLGPHTNEVRRQVMVEVASG